MRYDLGRFAAGLAVLLVCFVRPALAQISPGPLADAHAEFDRTSDCVQCHVRGEAMSDRCLTCHTEIRQLVSERKGFHGGEARAECQSCHPDHAGRDFKLIDWGAGGLEGFDHHRAGWSLQGAHADVKCRDCHQPKLQQQLMATHLKVKDHARSWLALDKSCLSCHEDPHKTRFGNDCLKCHTQAKWSAIKTESFDHDVTDYPLSGKHATLECETCHDAKKAWGRKPAYKTCDACHSDPHAGRALLAGKSVDCASCHDVNGFHPSTMPVAAHTLAQTGYALEGRHVEAACATCHTKDPKGVKKAVLGSAAVWMQPAHVACESCHADPHGKQLAAMQAGTTCMSCHDTKGFKPSRFDVADHARLAFALQGSHESTECRACHDAKRKHLPQLAAATAGKASFVFPIEQHSCISCHHDPHDGQLKDHAKDGAENCVACHDQKAFRPSRVDATAHQDYDFALEGAHAAIPCSDCHKELASQTKRSSLMLAAHGPALTFARETNACASCHESPHGKQFKERRDGDACEACHTLDAFEPAARFDHNRDARFQTKGAHAKAACASCHTPEGQGKSRVIIYRGTPTECSKCHASDGVLGARSTVPSLLLLTSRRNRDARIH